MKNMKMMMISLFAVAFVFMGCQALPQADATEKTTENTAQQQSNVTDKANAPAYELVQAPYPADVDQALEQIRKQGGYKVVPAADQTYVAIGLGQRNKGGFKPVINRVETANGVTTVYVSEQKPADGAMTIQVISYPTAVISLPKTSTTIKVVFA
ncbi:protease complex subunit PrcB family protein [Brevibacillus dissolubilis]|uniref:protease complex subunit PrcB family protein n=1 Tax=Brevibacillus dissolubilis TaxID=1844116 RepID=UPI0011170769|nr:protease complex subunit PrcB family protein [Brevibacillus dissolubilis]